MKYLFILGRNFELSEKEVESFLKRTGNEILSKEAKINALLIEAKNPLEKDAIDKLGGVICIGEVICKINELDKQELYFGTSNKLNYVIWNFSENYDEVSEYLKKRFKQEKLKAIEKKLTGQMEMQDNKKIEILHSKLIDEQFFVFEDYFGKIAQSCDYEKIEKRDMQKPVRRNELGISPRLAKIMINISEVKEKQRLVDGFCGIGIILQEAVLQDIKAIGIDKDKTAIEGARKNLEWLKISRGNYSLINNDSSRVKIRGNVFVAEPDFGELLRKFPNQNDAKTQIENFEKLMNKVLKNFENQISGRFVFTAPLIKFSRTKRVGCDIQKILEKTGLKLVEGFPIKDFQDEKIVGREVYILK